MHPVAFSIGSFTIHMYGVMAALGFAVGLFLMYRNAKYAGLSRDDAGSALFTAMVAGILGARVWHCVEYGVPLRDWIKIWEGGLVFYGGFIFASIAVIIQCKIKKLDLVRVMDCCIPSLAIGHLFGRIGCFLQGCCFGNPTTCSWGVNYPAGSDASRRFVDVLGHSQTLHPVQLYEAAVNFGFFWLFSYLLIHARRGLTVSGYIVCYGIARFVLEFFRGDYRPGEYWAGLTPGQVVSLALVPIGAALIYYFRKQDDRRKN